MNPWQRSRVPQCRMAAMLCLLAACKPEPDGPPPGEPTPPPTEESPVSPALVSGPEILAPTASTVRLVQRLVAATDRPTHATVVLDDGARMREITFPDLATEHNLPLLALLGETAYTVTATFTDAEGLSVSATAEFETGSPPYELLPTIELLHAEPARLEPGYVVFPVEIGPSHVVAVDAEGRVVGTWAGTGPTTRSLMFTDGTFTAMMGDVVYRWSPTGELLASWAANGTLVPYATVLPIEGLHHEVAFEPDGSFWTLYKKRVAVPDYPVSETDPSTIAPANIDADVVVHFAADGTLLHEWPLADRLDPTRIGFGSLVGNANGGYDWSHGNAIVPLPDEGAVLVSLRHQDAVVKLSLPDGELQWILGNPDGWSAAHQAFLLQPTGEFSWPYHQHGPMVGPDGRIVMFDNGNDFRTTPYAQDPDPAGLYSRIVQYEVDEATRQIRQTFESFGTEDRLYSQALGNADVLPSTGNVLATFPFLHEEGGVRNVDIGRGNRSVRLIEVDPSTGDTVRDLRLFTTSEASPTGVLVDRAIHVPSLYPPHVTERWLP